MGKQQTEKSRYPSRYSPGGFVTASQYLIELTCEKKTRSQKKDLPIQFWHLDEWKKIFMMQLRRAHKLLKLYPEKAIIRAINKNHIQSLLVPWLEEKIKQEEILLKTEVVNDQIIEQPENITFRTKTDILKDKLAELDR